MEIEMKILTAAGIALSFACVSAASGATNYQTYSGVPADSSPSLVSAFNSAELYCEPEATPYRRGSYPVGFGPLLAMRSCLARHNFIDRGVHSYLSITLGLDHFLDR
jgi:hypothetical protein